MSFSGVFALLVLVFSFSATAGEESFVCPENNVVYRGVTCCLEAVTESQCRQLVDELPEVALKAVKTVQAQHSQERYDFGRVPNCFWGAAVTLGLFPLEPVPSPLQPYELEDLLESSPLGELSTGAALEPGDLLLFEAQGEIREDIMENNIPKRKWFPFASLEHAAVYIGEGLVFQKENIGSAVFSLDSVENTRRSYERGWNRSPQYRGEMRIKAYR